MERHEFTEESLVAFLAEQFSIEEERLRPDATLEQLGLDSLGLLELIVALENQTGKRLLEDFELVTPSDPLSAVAALLTSALHSAPAQWPGSRQETGSDA
ncbi:phosphopantetheine-binding protein [Streptomyces sp. MMG1121]|uniref:phosphopantetheine-binding protein n=1 Tax=Streptomyces sp. MMG1121 TaxID=1415544 RepID=UPI0006AF9848|nr:phosphopantetheine-binding protein [Streptomyces sp. MMG1121]KOV57970.1 hypothetical protein ADK64_37760 [Streptomyces sp. MMG1121]